MKKMLIFLSLQIFILSQSFAISAIDNTYELQEVNNIDISHQIVNANQNIQNPNVIININNPVIANQNTGIFSNILQNSALAFQYLYKPLLGTLGVYQGYHFSENPDDNFDKILIHIAAISLSETFIPSNNISSTRLISLLSTLFSVEILSNINFFGTLKKSNLTKLYFESKTNYEFFMNALFAKEKSNYSSLLCAIFLPQIKNYWYMYTLGSFIQMIKKSYHKNNCKDDSCNQSKQNENDYNPNQYIIPQAIQFGLFEILFLVVDHAYQETKRRL